MDDDEHKITIVITMPANGKFPFVACDVPAHVKIATACGEIVHETEARDVFDLAAWALSDKVMSETGNP